MKSWSDCELISFFFFHFYSVIFFLILRIFSFAMQIWGNGEMGHSDMAIGFVFVECLRTAHTMLLFFHSFTWQISSLSNRIYTNNIFCFGVHFYLFYFVTQQRNRCTQRIKRTRFVILIQRFACTMFRQAHGFFLLSHFLCTHPLNVYVLTH